VALLYPNRYYLGMSNLGFQTVYKEFNKLEEVVCERFFLPEREDIAAFSSKQPLLSLESQRPLKDFAIAAFSVSFENDYPNLVHLLRLGCLTLYSSRRHQHEPLVVAGGVATFINPEPIAPFVDLFLLGEAEDLLSRFIHSWQQGQQQKMSKSTLLEQLACTVPGAYVPSLYRTQHYADGRLAAWEPLPPAPARIKIARSKTSRQQPAVTTIVTPDTEFASATLVELGRGCGRGCRFCAAGFVYRPVHFHSSHLVLRTVAEAGLPVDKVGLVSAAVSDHPEIDSLCLELRNQGCNLTISSLRADSLTPQLLETLAASGLRSLAIAPEAGSERLRRVINKKLSEAQILDAAAAIFESGFVHLRLYFMVGLPTETEEDVKAMVQLVKRLKHTLLVVGRGRGRLGTITVSLNSFVPKPFTPFQWTGFCDLAVLKKRIRKIKRELAPVANVRVHADVPRWAYNQALLSRGDRRLASLLEQLVKNQGNWPQAVKSVNVNPEFYVYRQRQRDELLPWDFMDHSIDKGFLWREYQRALAEKTTPACVPESCTACGVCPAGSTPS